MIRSLNKQLLQANKGVWQRLFQYVSENLILLHKMILPMINGYLLFALAVDQLEYYYSGVFTFCSVKEGAYFRGTCSDTFLNVFDERNLR